MSDDTRGNFSGDAQAFATLLSPLIENFGKKICSYPCEVAKVTAAKLDVRAVAEHHELLTCLHKGQQNLSFPKLVANEGIRLIVEQNMTAWKLKAGEVEDYIETQTRRLRNLCRVVGQGLIRKPQPKWVLDLPFMKIEAESTPPPKRSRSSRSSPKAEVPLLLFCTSRPKAGAKSSPDPVPVPACPEPARPGFGCSGSGQPGRPWASWLGNRIRRGLCSGFGSVSAKNSRGA
jgi:hypothetical protein